MASTRDRIIVGTNELFRRHGYNGTSMSQISEAAEATMGSIYHFFPGGKEALGVAVIETTGAVYRELFETFARDAQQPEDMFHDFFAGAAEILEQSDFIDPCPIGGIAREVANSSEALRSAAARAFESWIMAVRDHLTERGIPADLAEELGSVFVSTVEGTFVLSRTLRSAAPLISAGRFMTDLTEYEVARATEARTGH